MRNPSGVISPDLRAALENAGFAQSASGRPYRRGALTARVEDGWFLLEQRAARRDWLSRVEARAGLWRSVPGAAPGRSKRTFEITPRMFDPGRRTNGGARTGAARRVTVDGVQAWRSILDWAVTTERGIPPATWQAPSADHVQEWIGDRLTLRSGPHLRRGRVLRESDRLVLEFPLIGPVPDALSDARRMWLKMVLLDVATTWRLVRVHSGESGGFATSIDLSGAPRHTLPELTTAALDALRWATSWALPTLAVITDPNTRSRLLETAPPSVPLAGAGAP